MKSVFFGLSLQYDTGVQTAVAINANGVIVEVHKSQAYSELWYHVGMVSKVNAEWGPSVKYDSGVTPSCAINQQNKVVEVHKSGRTNDLWYHVGTVSGTSIDWSASRKYASGGIAPRVAMNDQGQVVEVHQSDSSSALRYRVGILNGDSVDWGGNQFYDWGTTPSVALNNSGVLVEVHKSTWDGSLWYHVGRMDGSSITWGPSVNYDEGISPSVALTDDGLVIEVHQSQFEGTLWQRVGRVNGNSIDWIGAAAYFDDGAAPVVACGGSLSIQTHMSESFTSLWFSLSLITDRANWMQDNLSALGSMTLKQMTLPASHDAGMYLGSLTEMLGKTQDLDLYGQLSYGIRYYDLRPGFDGKDLYIYHGPVKGPRLSDVLYSVSKFMSEGHRELVILKFSHYRNLTDKLYRGMVQRIQDILGAWLLTRLVDGKRLADTPLDSYLGSSGVVLAVCDGSFPVDNPAEGIWVYRDWNSDTAEQGDLRVFDEYSGTMFYIIMLSDQLAKFQGYTGKCKKNTNLPCDLFLLSWTLTPPTAVWPISKAANRNLGLMMAALEVPNRYGCIPNLLYVDYVEYARVTDVAMMQNGALSGGPSREVR